MSKIILIILLGVHKDPLILNKHSFITLLDSNNISLYIYGKCSKLRLSQTIRKMTNRQANMCKNDVVSLITIARNNLCPQNVVGMNRAVIYHTTSEKVNGRQIKWTNLAFLFLIWSPCSYISINWFRIPTLLANY